METALRADTYLVYATHGGGRTLMFHVVAPWYLSAMNQGRASP